ncbi:MAG: gluconate 2-dehydrogenase subunit 3 family protein [Candidatus Binataceae bacterium]|nr:gluconate 2-dehydrogenase subunit 3 family protein [Candidatus Binataceae bacterium]
MKRREFLQKGAIAVAGVAIATSGAAAVSFAASWTAELKAFSEHEGETLLKMVREIFPHDRLADSYYIKVVHDLDQEAQATPASAQMMHDGIAQLDAGGAKKFAARSSAEQVAGLKRIETTPFFQKVRGIELVSLYNNPAVWKRFGYPGASYPFGGYLHHGFNDLKWLPDPPASASPKAS